MAGAAPVRFEQPRSLIPKPAQEGRRIADRAGWLVYALIGFLTVERVMCALGRRRHRHCGGRHECILRHT
jgi:hypothetical protein